MVSLDRAHGRLEATGERIANELELVGRGLERKRVEAETHVLGLQAADTSRGPKVCQIGRVWQVSSGVCS